MASTVRSSSAGRCETLVSSPPWALTGAPHDNAVTESVMATIKRECVHRHRFKTRDEVRLAVFTYVEGFYNPHRRHSTLGNLSPVEFERRLEQRRQEAVAC